MNIGTSIRTLPTVKPKLYAGKVGVIAVRNEDEFGVLINGKIVWFVEKEIETCGQTVSASGITSTSAGSADKESSAIRQTRSVTREGASASTTASVTDATRERQQCPDLSAGWPARPPQHPVTNPSRAVPGSERPSEPRPPSAPPRGSGDLSGFNPGERGPGGGVVAKCVACGGKWERPKQRGRPSLKCPTCR